MSDARTSSQPSGWTTEDARRDPSWIQRLTADEVAGFDAALAHAKAAGKTWLQMTAEDFPLSPAARLRRPPVRENVHRNRPHPNLPRRRSAQERCRQQRSGRP